MSTTLRGSRSVHRSRSAAVALPRWRPEVPAPQASRELVRHRPGGGQCLPEAPPCSARPAGAASESGQRRKAAESARLRRRRVLLGTAAAGILVALALPWGGTGGHTLASPGPVLAGATVAPHADYIVQPGDTMWSIAEKLDPGGDPRVIVAELAAQVGSDTLQVGERVHLP